MNITWLGQNCFKLEGKTAAVLTDPFDLKTGQKITKVGADIFVLSKPLSEKDHSALKSDIFVIDTPGEYEVKEVSVDGTTVGPKGNTVFRISMDGIHIGYLGNQLDVSEQTENALDGVDVLLVPVGGGDGLGPREAVDAVNRIEPRIVIPMNYRQPGFNSLEPVEKFCLELGSKPDNVKKLNITKKDLPADETKLVILEV